jgi:hypothetical protein
MKELKRKETSRRAKQARNGKKKKFRSITITPAPLNRDQDGKKAILIT